jgi:hypothetical protein
MQEHEKGLLEVLRANAPKPTPLSPAEQAKADFAADNPEIDVDKAAKALKNDPKFMDRSAPPEAPAPDESPVANDPDEGFEATEEELSAQIGRGAAREAETADVV